VGTGGLSWASKEREALDCLGAILGGTSGRLFSNLRDRDALAYTVSPLLTYGCDPGILGTYIACSPEKKERAVGALMREFEALVKAPPSAGELERAINFIVGNHEAEMQRGEAQAMSMALMSTFGIGHEEFMHYPARIKKVEGEAVRRVAARILAQQPMISVSVGP
jgi:zinc protease